METPNFVKKENIEPKAEILSIDDLINEIYKGENLPQDERFLSVDEGGVFKYLELKNILNGSFNKKDERVFPVVRLGNEIVALSELEKDPRKDNNFWIKFVCVDPKYQNKGYAKNLIEKIFKFAKENNSSLETSIYSDEGLEKIKKTIERFGEDTGVKVLSRNHHI